MSIFSSRFAPASRVFRQGRAGVNPDVIILHHSATTNLGVVRGMMTTGSRKVSSNVVIGNNGDIHPVVWESDTPFTNGHLGWNRRSYTAEIINSAVGGSWPVSRAAHEAAAQWCAHLHRKHGIRLDRTHVFGHRELYSRYHAGYATACPGGLDLDWIVKRARQIAGGATPQPETNTADAEEEDEDMAKNVMHHTTDDKYDYRIGVTNPGSGFALVYVTSDPDINNELAKQYDTGSSVKVSRSLFDAIIRSTAAVAPQGELEVKVVEA